MDVIRLSHINPDAAIAKAEGLPSGVDRSLAILQVAHDIAGDDPERAAKLIAEAQPADQPPNASLQLELISARANVAAAEQKKEELRELLESGFDSANRAIVDKKAQFAGLGALVQLGIQNEPELTVSFLENLPPSAVKANLLMGAVAALNMKGRLPLSSRPRPNQENAAKQ